VNPAGWNVWARRGVLGSISSDPHNPLVDCHTRSERPMDSIIYLVGLVVVIMFILSLLGLH
jgi:hypothetical protein